MTQTSLPGARTAFTDANGRPTPQFYRYLQTREVAQLANPTAADLSAINAQIEALQATIEAIPAGQFPTLRVNAPLTSAGLLQNGFAMLGWAGTTDDVPEGTTNLYYTLARVYAAAKGMFKAGANITLTPDDTAETLTIDSTGGTGTLARSWVMA